MPGRKPAKIDEEILLTRAVNVQLLKNLMIWGELQEQGAGEEPELRLTFAYVAADEERAERLVAFLGAETDYELYVRRRGRVGGRRWFVAGATQPARVSLETLNAWTEWMIAAGAGHGECAFDGWAPQES
ncbi:MAG: hypothetical protein QOJ46_1230 [bacterium]|nr:hypothetical protein [Gaiellales bacterium]